MALATLEQVAQGLGRELTDAETRRAQFLLDQLSAKFVHEARTSFTVEDHVHRVKVNGGHARPPRGPIVSVSGVVDDDGAPVPWRLGHGLIHVPLPSDRFVVVTYRAGYTRVPPVVAGQVADSVRRALGIDPRAAAGVTQAATTTGPFTESASFAAWAVGGQAMLSPDDIALARSYRPHRPNVWVGGAR